MINKIRIGFMLFAVALLSSFSIDALEISLSGEGGSGPGGGKIGIVDMQKIYQIAPQTLNAKSDYMKKLEEKQAFLLQKEKDLESIKSRVAVLETTIKMDSNGEPPEELANVEASTAPHKSVSELKAELEEKELEYREARKLAQDDLAAFEKNQNQIIFGNIYKALKDVAQEEQVSIVVDKASVLFGGTEVDLTEKLQARIRGF